MLWKEVRTWAKTNGYDIVKDKSDGKYYWAQLVDNSPSASGVASSVSKVARAIFNHITNDKWIDHQQEYETNKEIKKMSVSDYGS